MLWTWKKGVFAKDDPRSIARSLKRSKLKRLQAAKEELRELYGKPRKTA